MHLDVATIAGLVGLGLVSGVAGGLLGIGGGVVNVPGLTLLFGAPGALARSGTLLVNSFIGLSSAMRHRRARCVLAPVHRLMLVGGVVGGALGALLAHWLDPWKWVFPAVFSVFLMYVIVQNMRRLMARRADAEAQLTPDDPFPITRERLWGLLGAGFPMGVSAGMLGIGGGAIGVPLQQALVRMPLRNAIACSSATIVGTCAIAAGVAIPAGSAGAHASFLWWQPLVLAAVLIPSAVVGAQLGAHLTHRLPLRAVRIVFVAVIALSCVKMAQQSVDLYRHPPQASATQEAPRP